MKKRWMVTGSAALVAALTMSFGVGAATIESSDHKIKMETPDDQWAVVEEANVKLALTDGKNKVTVCEYQKDDEIPMPGTAEEKYVEAFQIYYSTAESVYCISGYAVSKNDIKTVRSVAESFELSVH